MVIFDKDNIIAATNKKKDYIGKQISVPLEELLEDRKSYLLTQSENSKMLPIFQDDNNTYLGQIIVPILANSDIVGGIVAFENETNKLTVADVKILQTIAGFIAKQVEWKNNHF